MGRQKLYHTPEEKLAANRSKSQRHYEKKASAINAKRRRKYNWDKASASNGKDKSTARSPAEQVVQKESAEEKRQRKIDFYMFKAENIKRLLTVLTEGDPRQFADTACVAFLKSGEKDGIHKHVIELGKLQRRIVRCQDEILQLAGIGKEWDRLSAIAEDVRTTSTWVEEIFCYAMVDYSEVEGLHSKAEFMYQVHRE